MNVKEFLVQRITTLLQDDYWKSDLAPSKKKKKTIVDIALDLDIRWYAQCDEGGRDTYSYPLWKMIAHHAVTRRAAQKLKELMGSEVTQEALRNAVHYEHNPPVKVIRKELLKLQSSKATAAKIKRILEEEYNVIIISREEARVLNGKYEHEAILDDKKIQCKGLKSRGTAQERLKAIEATFLEESGRHQLADKLKKSRRR